MSFEVGFFIQKIFVFLNQRFTKCSMFRNSDSYFIRQKTQRSLGSIKLNMKFIKGFR